MISEVNDIDKFSYNINKINNDNSLCNEISIEASNLFKILMNDNNFAPALQRIFTN